MQDKYTNNSAIIMVAHDTQPCNANVGKSFALIGGLRWFCG